MNAYKLNGIAGHVTRQAICKELNIHHTDLYKTVKNIDSKGLVELKDGRKFQIVLKYIGNF